MLRKNIQTRKMRNGVVQIIKNKEEQLVNIKDQ
jgi:hypothetical protein